MTAEPGVSCPYVPPTQSISILKAAALLDEPMAAEIHPKTLAEASNSQTVFMFSGQGSQYYHMGAGLFEKNATFRDCMAWLDDIARPVLGRSIIETLYSDLHSKGDSFDRTLLTHPAIFMLQYSLAQCVMNAGLKPDIVLGVSLGSFAAATIAGFITVEDALQSVIRQAAALEECCEPGGMTAVFAPSQFAGKLLDACELAAVNSSSHFVVSATSKQLGRVEATLRQHNVNYQRLPVSVPFHSRWIENAKLPFISSMGMIRLSRGRLPFVCCDNAAILHQLSADYFWNVIRHPIRFCETVAHIEQQCAFRYIDLGPSGTLATFLKYGLPGGSKSTVHALLTPYGLNQNDLLALLDPIKAVRA